MRRNFFFLVLLCIVFPIHASETEITGRMHLPRDIFLIPQTVFVGDRGRLVVNLGPAFEEAEARVFLSPAELPVVEDMAIHRMELEKRNNNIRLLIDFIPYAPGTFRFPLIRIPSIGSEPLILGGLELNVASVLSPDFMVLSAPALPLSVPGTGLIVYGGAGVILFIIIVGIGALYWTQRYLGPFREKLKRRRLLISLEQRIKDLNNEENDPIRQKELLSLLAGEFRDFLSLLTGFNCRVLSPLEFLDLSVSVPAYPEPDFFCSLFRRWDNLRFSGGPLAREHMLGLLDELGLFLTKLNSEEKSQ